MAVETDICLTAAAGGLGCGDGAPVASPSGAREAILWPHRGQYMAYSGISVPQFAQYMSVGCAAREGRRRPQARASLKSPVKTSFCSSVSMSGGIRRMVVPWHTFTSTPFSRQYF